jgi:predicted ester cyclase
MIVVDEFYAPDVVIHTATGRDIHSLKDFKQFASDQFVALPDNHVTVDDVIVEGDRTVVRCTSTGTHEGEFMGIPATNKKITMSMISITRHNTAGKVVEQWDRYDTLGLMQQLGLVPTPGKGK